MEPVPIPTPAIDAGDAPTLPAGARSVSDAVGWVASLVLHAAVLVTLALATFPPTTISTAFRLIAGDPVAESLDEGVTLDDAQFDLAAAVPAESLAAADAPLEAVPSGGSLAASPEALAPALDLSALLASASVSASTDVSLSVVAGQGTAGRTPAGRATLVEAKGGSRASEVAVARALDWLEEHQNADGTWSLVHDRGECRGRCGAVSAVGGDDPFGESLASGTGLALLPFLGAGETHLTGRHKRVVAAGLEALVKLGKFEEERRGLSWADSGRMYAHGICTIVLCEAYGLTKDPALRAPAEAAVAYLAAAQDPAGGGWRYTPQQAGDTSVTGWQVMAVKSASLAGIVPPRRVSERAMKFLDSAAADGGARYGYLATPEGTEAEGRPTLSAVGLLCRQYLGWEQKDERLARGVAALGKAGPISGNYYHNYYVAQTIFHHTGGVGRAWSTWNEAVRDQLVQTQAKGGHERGSWWAPGHHNERGGRLYATALATMTLEVYYRYLPLYQTAAVAGELPD